MKSSSSVPSTTLNSSNIFNDLPLIKELNPVQLEALKFGLSSLFLGTSGGLLFGSGTSLMRGLQDSPAGRANLLKSFKLFSNFNFKILIHLIKIIFRYCWNKLRGNRIKFNSS